MSGFERFFKKRTIEPAPLPTQSEIDAQRERRGCGVCADKGERTIDNKKASSQTGVQHSLRTEDQISGPARINDDTPIYPLAQKTNVVPTKTTYDAEQVNQSAQNCECLAYQNSTCPLNRRELGRASWAYLHTLAATYPQNPTNEEQTRMSRFVQDFAAMYPCGYCADYTRKEMIRRPPKVSNRREFQIWMCGVHNEVNYRMNKPLFDCNFVDERWGAGPPDGSCGETQL